MNHICKEVNRECPKIKIVDRTSLVLVSFSVYDLNRLYEKFPPKKEGKKGEL